MNRLEELYYSLKLFVMIWYIVGLVVAFGLGFFVGANNPPSSIRRKIISAAQDSLNKIKNA